MTAFAEYKQTAFFGRSFEELLLCFGLSIDDLIGKRVLDCPAGPSSFVAEANALGIDAIGVDPMFYRGPEALERLARADCEAMYRKIAAKPEYFVAKTFASIEESRRSRFAALQRFVEDYRSGYLLGRYMMGELPSLPFPDASFDLVVCGHLLFLYEERFGFEFFEASLLELCRVARQEVRVHPIVDVTGNRYRALNALMEGLEAAGHLPRIIEVDHEFFRGTNQTLVIQVC